MRSALGSRRRRRRIAFGVVAIGIAIPLIYLGVHFSTPGSPGAATGPALAEPDNNTPKNVPFTAQKRRAVRRVLARFISTAVTRKDVASSWAIVGPSLRAGMTRKQWATGDIPVTPYPAARHGQGTWDVVQYSYPSKVGLEVLVFPKPHSGYSLATADVDVVRGRDDRWRVDYWMITKFHGPGAPAPADSTSALSEGPPNVHQLPGRKASARHKASTTAAGPDLAGPPKVGAIWLAVPLGILALIVVLPLSIGTYFWLRNRRAAAEYRRSKA
ncbi:MAG: hypothetical protein ACJ768_08775 [Gaiellaceae bacterium]